MILRTLLLVLLLTGIVLAQDDGYLSFAEVMPTPVGGIESIYKNITYPELARKANLKGKVYLLVYINEKGDVDNARVVKGIGGGCDEAALSALKKIKFNPAKSSGVPVKIKYAVAVEFRM
jgi:periplasmic protein TonB